jgi:hypothetical protein
MPCSDCHRMLALKQDSTSLFCPNCQGRPVEAPAVVKATTNWLIQDYFADERIVEALQEYSKPNLLYYLIQRLNHISYRFCTGLKTGMPVSEFGYIAYLIKQVYKTEEFGEKLLDDPEELDDDIRIMRDAYAELIETLRRARNEFDICIKKPGYTGSMENFATDYDRIQSEYGLCFERCVRSLIGGEPVEYEDFSHVMDEIRGVERTEVTEAGTPWEFADAVYELLNQFKVVASADEMIGKTYYTRLPKDVTVFEIREFLELLDNVYRGEMFQKITNSAYVPPMEPHWVDKCGQRAFGSDWEQVRDQVIVSKDNLEAHPFLFALEVYDESISDWKTQIYYPRWYSQLLKFQIFPLLKNGEDDRTGHELLTDIAGDRGKKRERNLYDLLADKDIECYHSAEITRNDPNEIDLLYIQNQKLTFIEVKYLLPPKRLNDREGIRIINEKMNFYIFNEKSEKMNREPEGKSFPEKVSNWLTLSPGDTFNSQVNRDGERDDEVVPKGWNDFDVEKYVVSNVVPSYIVKQDIRFLTDLEFYRLIEYGDESCLYSLP